MRLSFYCRNDYNRIKQNGAIVPRYNKWPIGKDREYMLYFNQDLEVRSFKTRKRQTTLKSRTQSREPKLIWG